jgi:hypothetical protein
MGFFKKIFSSTKSQVEIAKAHQEAYEEHKIDFSTLTKRQRRRLKGKIKREA